MIGTFCKGALKLGEWGMNRYHSVRQEGAGQRLLIPRQAKALEASPLLRVMQERDLLQRKQVAEFLQVNLAQPDFAVHDPLWVVQLISTLQLLSEWIYG